MKKNFLIPAILLSLFLTACHGSPVQTAETTAAESSAAVAEGAQTAPPVELSLEGLNPMTAQDLEAGVYDIEVESSSSMFRIASAQLVVGESMTARLRIESSSYGWLFAGTAEMAAAARQADWIGYTEEEGARVFTFPLEAIDAPVDCAAFSERKSRWYDRTLIFHADSLPQEAFRTPYAQVKTASELGIPDGDYTAQITLSGGSGKASVASPAQLHIEKGQITAHIVWSSPNYDYMLVDGTRYDPVNTEGNSAFDIPLAGFDAPIQVTADTTAMSTPHEIEYTLTLDYASLK